MATTVDYGPCSACGEINSHHAKTCRACGAQLPWKVAPQAHVPFWQRPLWGGGGARTASPTTGQPRTAPQATAMPQGATVPQATPVTSAPVPDDGWYYAHGSGRVGPVSGAEVMQLVAQGRILRDTLVWRPGMNDWAAAGTTQLLPLFPTMMPGPPPLTPDAINDSVVWTLAFAPIAGALLQIVLAASLRTPVDELWWVTLCLNIVLCAADVQMLKRAGHDTSGWGVLAFLLVPAYLFVRATKLGQSNGYAWAWVASFVVSLFIG